MNNFNELVLAKKEQECDLIASFYFKAKDGSKLKKPIAGQFLAFKLKTENEKYKNAFRAYTLSNKPNEEFYRITVKKVEGGLISSYLHDKLDIGDCILAKEPCGIFTVDKAIKKEDPIVFISAGIGVTPLLAMLYEEEGKRDNITFIQAVQHSKMHPFGDEIKDICKKNAYKNIVFYSNPLEEDKEGKDYDVKGFITKLWLEENISINSNFYFCGPPVFMEKLEKDLLDLGASREKIHFETFA